MLRPKPRDTPNSWIFKFQRRVRPAHERVPDQVHAVSDVAWRRMEREGVGIEEGAIAGCHSAIVQDPVGLAYFVEAVQLVEDGEVGALAGDSGVAEEAALGGEQGVPGLVGGRATFGECLVEGKGVPV